MNAIAYVRRSDKSEDRNVSLAQQEAAIRAYCQTAGLSVVHVLSHDGISGGNRARFDRIKEAVLTHKAEAVVVYHHDRFSRDVAGLLDTVREFDKKDVGVYVVNRGRIDVKSASGFLTNSMEGVVAEHFRLIIGEKTSHALKKLAADGYAYGPPLYGFKNVNGTSQHSTREVVPEEGKVVRKLFSLRAEGLSYLTIARTLTSRGIPSPTGGQWRPSTVRHILHHPLYRGPIIPEPLWQKAHRFTGAGITRSGRPPAGSSPYLLAGFAECALCKASLIGWNRGKGRTRVYRCYTRHHEGKDGCENGLAMPVEVLDRAVLEALSSDEFIESVVKALLMRSQGQHDDTVGDSKEKSHDRTQLEAELARLSEAVAKIGPDDALLGKIKATRERLADLRVTKKKMPNLTEKADQKALRGLITGGLWDWRTFLRDHPQMARGVLKDAVASRIKFFPERDQRGGFYRFEGCLDARALLVRVPVGGRRSTTSAGGGARSIRGLE